MHGVVFVAAALPRGLAEGQCATGAGGEPDAFTGRTRGGKFGNGDDQPVEELSVHGGESEFAGGDREAGEPAARGIAGDDSEGARAGDRIATAERGHYRDRVAGWDGVWDVACG